MNNKLQRNKPVVIVAGIVTLFFLVITIWLMLPAGNSAVETIKIYSELTSKSNGTVDKKLMFVAAYVKATGDVTIAQRLGYSQQVIDEVLNPTDPGDEDPSSTPVGDLPPATEDDWTSIVIELMRTWRVGELDDPYHNQENWTITYGGRTATGYYKQCCSGVYAILQLTGKINSTGAGSWGVAACNTGGTSIGIPTTEQLQCGDVICWGSRHTAIVVKVDSNYVYILDCGNSECEKVALNYGYSVKIERNSNLANGKLGHYEGSPILPGNRGHSGSWYPYSFNPPEPNDFRRY